MPAFSGFPSGKVRFYSLPAPFFTDLLPAINHLAEMKVTLYVLWYLDQLEGSMRYIRREDFTQDLRFMAGLGKTPEEAQAALDEGLERAVHRNSLLKAEIHLDTGDQVLYFLNSPRGKAAIQAIQNGEWAPTGDQHQPIGLNLERPNIYRLYEENIGLLTPMIAETLRETEQTYPAQWIEEAVRIAVENNVRRWRYIEAILRSWQEEGRDEQNRGDSQKDRRRYVEGQFADFIEH
jgi:DNA replication protein